MKIIQNSEAVSLIIISQNATWLERYAACELQKYVEKISGVRILIIKEGEDLGLFENNIYIGRQGSHNAMAQKKAEGMALFQEGSRENDAVYLAADENTLIISGSNERSVFYSVCHLLQKWFHVGFYYDGDSIEEMEDLEVSPMCLTERSPFRFRHTVGQWVYNFGAFLSGEERKRELEMYARNKINSYRVYNWNSYVKKRTFQKMGVSTDPITPQDMERMREVQITVEYARNLGMEIMVQMMIQETSLEFLETYPGARYFGCEWVKDDGAEAQTIPCLYPDDPVYKKLVKTFVQTWIETYGPASNFTACPPSEHHISADLNEFIDSNILFAKYTWEAVKEIVPDGRFFFDGWGVRANTPPHIWTMPGVMERFVEALPEDVYFLDLWPDRKESVYGFREPMYRDENFSALKRASYILEPLNEFGGDDHMHGDFGRHIEAAKEMIDPQVVEKGAGFGNCTELCGFSNHFFDLLFRLAWNPGDVTLEGFLEDTVRQRYGSSYFNLKYKAMKNLQKAVYSGLDSSHARYQKRCYLARVQRRLVPVSESLQITALLKEYMEQMMALPMTELDNPFIGRDLFDVVRQYITEYFNIHLQSMFQAFSSRNQGDWEQAHKLFLHHKTQMGILLKTLETMVKEDGDSYLEKYVRLYEGRACDPDVSGLEGIPEDFRAWMRDLGSTFAKQIPNLIDYPSRDYYELIVYYYIPRIRAAADYLEEQFKCRESIRPEDLDEKLEDSYREVEKEWIETGYPVNDDYAKPHMPLGRAAVRAFETLTEEKGIGKWLTDEEMSVSQRADVFASYSENHDEEQQRSWVEKNPFENNK